MSGLTGGEGFRMHHYVQRTNGGLCGPFLGKAMARALAVAGCNASMGRIVAAPTAGSCGILPGCLISLLEEGMITEKEAVMSMFTAGAFGIVIANRSSIAGAISMYLYRVEREGHLLVREALDRRAPGEAPLSEADTTKIEAMFL